MNSKEYYTKKIQSFNDYDQRIVPEFSFEDLDMLSIQHIHFTAVCGKAMASLAGMLVEKGFFVTGSDCECYEPMASVVHSSGIHYLKGFDGSYVEKADVIIMGNACPSSNPEAISARLLKKPQLSIAEALHYFCIRDKKSIVVTGTHGKTTTTSYISEVLSHINLNPSFLVGGVVEGLGTSFRYKNESEYIVVEGDEYDSAYFDKRPKFFHYNPYILIITSLEFDHADIYNDFAEYYNAFKMLVEEKQKPGVIIACADDVNVFKLLQETQNQNFISYGISEGDLKAFNITTTHYGEKFDVSYKDIVISNIQIPLFGYHNIRNALSVIAVLLFLGIQTEIIQKSMNIFSGSKERQEVLGEFLDTVVMKDFAHHPTAVKETLFAIKRKYNSKRIVAVFEPRSTTSRKKMFELPYAESLSLADIVVIQKPLLRSQDNVEDVLSVDFIKDFLKSKEVECYISDDYESTLTRLVSITKNNDCIVFMSNGSFGDVPSLFLKTQETKQK